MFKQAKVKKLEFEDGKTIAVGDHIKHRKGWTGKVKEIRVPVHGSAGTTIRAEPDDFFEAERLSRAWPLAYSPDNDGVAIYGRDIGLTMKEWIL